RRRAAPHRRPAGEAREERPLVAVERATGERGSRGRKRKRLDGRDTLAPTRRCTGGSLGIRRGRIRLAADPGSAAECTVPSLDLFLPRPLTTVRDRRATNAPARANPC